MRYFEVQQIKSPTTLDAIGKTPIVQLRKIVPKGSADILVKLEYFNPTNTFAKFRKQESGCVTYGFYPSEGKTPSPTTAHD